MISTNTPLLSQGLSVPKEMEQLSVEAFTAGIMEGALDALGFVRIPLDLLAACAGHSALCADGGVSVPHDDPHQARCLCDGARGGPGRAIGLVGRNTQEGSMALRVVLVVRTERGLLTQDRQLLHDLVYMHKQRGKSVREIV